MENNNMILSNQKVSKEYQIPELVDLNSAGEAQAACWSGSANSDGFGCSAGMAASS